jgi:hypothetical protein
VLLLRVKIVDADNRVLKDDKIPQSVMISMCDFARIDKHNDYILKDYVYIRNDGSEAAKELFSGSALEFDGDDILIIEVEKVCNSGE